jgi:hypothetical protein
MKKILLTLCLALSLASIAKAQFFYGIQFGFFTDWGSETTKGQTPSAGGSSFNYTLKPTIGYYFNDRLMAGVKFVYTSCSTNVGDGSFSPTNLRWILRNVMMGNGLDSDYMSWKVRPYMRYNVLRLAKDKLKLWVELNGYIGGKVPRLETKKLDWDSRSLIYGVQLHPVVTFDITDRFLVFTSLDILSIGYDGTRKLDTATKQNTGSFYCQLNPLNAIGEALLNIGIQRHF